MSMSNSMGHGLIRQAVRRSSVINVPSRTHPGVCGSYSVPPGHKADLASQQKLKPPLLSTRFLENSLTATKTKVFQGKHRAMTMVPRATLAADPAQELVLAIKGKLEREHSDLPVGKNGRDDEDMILWFLKDRKFSVDDAVGKLTKAIKWRQDFGVSGLSEESVKSLYGTGKAYVHDLLDINGRPVLVVVASKHFPAKQDMRENEKLCVFLIEKALSKLPHGTEEILGIFDLRGFSTENGDILFFKFLMDVFYYYYPRRLGQVLFVDSPFVFQPIWQLVKPLMKSYASLVKFCNAETVRKEYFTEATVPADFKN